MKFVAVTSCPTGIAHTYMAAEAIEQAGAKAGHEVHVETQGAAGADPLDPAVIAAADAVIFAADVEVRNKERFAGKPLVVSSVKHAISGADDLIAQAVQAVKDAPASSSIASGGPALATKVTANASAGTKIRQWLMTGVSYMIPFVAAGGILIALSFMLGGYQIYKVPFSDLATGFNPLSLTHWAALMFWVGKAAFLFMVPSLAAFLAFAIADRPGIVPGFVGGLLCTSVSPDLPGVGAGFLGGIAAGFVAGFIARWLTRLAVPKAIKAVMPVVVTPLVATFATGVIMVAVLGRPLKWVFDGLTHWLTGLTGANLIILGIILGLMMAFDMGGPVNKVAYSFATAGLTAEVVASTGQPAQLKIMAIVMAAGMTPPLGLALATVLRPKQFTDVERENGVAAWLLGASFITEGAIPFAAADPLRVIPSLMLGSGVTGALVALFGSTSKAPHGGIWVTPLIGQPLLYLLAIVIGTAVTAGAVIVAKGIKANQEAPVEAMSL
jgi:PTS system fructose-specific IIC component